VLENDKTNDKTSCSKLLSRDIQSDSETALDKLLGFRIKDRDMCQTDYHHAIAEHLMEKGIAGYIQKDLFGKNAHDICIIQTNALIQVKTYLFVDEEE